MLLLAGIIFKAIGILVVFGVLLGLTLASIIGRNR